MPGSVDSGMMENKFYLPFDYQFYHERKTDYRTAFQQDRDRIIHTFAFRRLQAKTQVFFSGEYDFYRTRLTHSIEVAQIGRSICHFLNSNSPHLSKTFFIDPELVEGICLAHDLGHPPFGHAGERSLNCLMKDYGGFEGNAQTLRILTDTIYSQNGQRSGMSPSRAFVDGVLKYKSLFSQLENPLNHFIYDFQEKVLNFVFNNRLLSNHYKPGVEMNSFKSIECQIMDWADDTAFSINDIIDGIKAGFLTWEKVKSWADTHSIERSEEPFLDQLLEIIHKGSIEARLGKKVGNFIQNCSLHPQETFMDDLTHRYKFRLVIDPLIKTECGFYKRLAQDVVFQSSQLSQLEYKGQLMLERLFKTLVNNYVCDQPALSLLPKDEETILSQQGINKVRIICDYIAGMTDRYAVRFYKRLFDPDFGSIVEF